MSESDGFAVIPSLGPLVPGHSLLCPRVHLRSISELPPDHEREYQRAKAALRGRLSALYDADVHVFEHGMARGGRRTLCTVEHAHVHFVPMPPACTVELGPDPRWTRFDGSLKQLRRLAAGREYIAYEVADGEARMLAAGESELESQYMRKVIARALGRPQEWDWRAKPDAAAADAAWRRFIAHPVSATR
jgi:diadenosine tetraphosphate (Ap4A) HIT family hydrolase